MSLNLADFSVPLLYKSFSFMCQQITTTVSWWCSTYRWAFTQLFHLPTTNISLSTSTWQQRQQLEVGSDICKGPQQHCLPSCLVRENLPVCTQHLWEKQQLWSRRAKSRPSGLNITTQGDSAVHRLCCLFVLWSLCFKEICRRKGWNVGRGSCETAHTRYGQRTPMTCVTNVIPTHPSATSSCLTA